MKIIRVGREGWAYSTDDPVDGGELIVCPTGERGLGWRVDGPAGGDNVIFKWALMRGVPPWSKRSNAGVPTHFRFATYS